MSEFPPGASDNQTPDLTIDTSKSFSQTRSITPSPPQLPSRLNQQDVPSKKLQSPAPIKAHTVSPPPPATQSATLSAHGRKPKIRLPDEQSTEVTGHTVTTARVRQDNRDIRLPPDEDGFVYDLSGAQVAPHAPPNVPDPRLDPAVPSFIPRRRGILPTIEEETSNHAQENTAPETQGSENMSGMQREDSARPKGSSEQVQK